jgi:hypothetical protein
MWWVGTNIFEEYTAFRIEKYSSAPKREAAGYSEMLVHVAYSSKMSLPPVKLYDIIC